MNCVLIDCEYITLEDINSLNQTLISNYNLEVINSTKKELFQSTHSVFVAMVFVLQDSVLSGVIYDAIKYSILYILSKLKNRKESKDVTVEINLNGKKDTIYFNFELNELQKEKIVDAAIHKYIKETE